MRRRKTVLHRQSAPQEAGCREQQGGTCRAGRCAAAKAGLLLTAVTLTLLPGCVHHAPLSLRRVWFDFNTLGKPALVYEKTDRLPPRAHQVDRFRWMYNAGPGEQIPTRQRLPVPLAAPRIWTAAAGVAEPENQPHAPVPRGPHPPLAVPPGPQP